MKNRLVEIHLPKFYKFIPIAIILNVIQKILSESITNYYKNAIINLSLTSIGQSFSIFLYIYQKYKNLDTFSFNVNKKNLIFQKIKKKYYFLEKKNINLIEKKNEKKKFFSNLNINKLWLLIIFLKRIENTQSNIFII